jgi:hypothetical protein
VGAWLRPIFDVFGMRLEGPFPHFCAHAIPQRDPIGSLPGAFLRVKAGIDVSTVFGSLFSLSWEGRWPPSVVNSSKHRGRAFLEQVHFMTDPGSMLDSFWELFRALLLPFLASEFGFPFRTLLDHFLVRFW